MLRLVLVCTDVSIDKSNLSPSPGAGIEKCFIEGKRIMPEKKFTEFPTVSTKGLGSFRPMTDYFFLSIHGTIVDFITLFQLILYSIIKISCFTINVI